MSCDELTGSAQEKAQEERDGRNVEADQLLIGGVKAVELDDQRFRLDGLASSGGISAHHYTARFKLKEGESLTFFFFASRNLLEGARFTFSRTNSELHLDIEISQLHHSLRLRYLEEDLLEDDILDLEFDVHNDHEDMHNLIWAAGDSRGDRFGCTVDSEYRDESVDPCVYNSEDFAFDYWLGVGRAAGRFWGIQGNKERVIRLSGPSRRLSDA